MAEVTWFVIQKESIGTSSKLSLCVCLIQKKFFKEIMHFHYMAFMAAPWHKIPCPRRHVTYNLSRLFNSHQYNLLCLSDLCLWLEKKLSKEIMHFHYMAFMATPWHKNPCPRGHETYNLSRLFIGHQYNLLSFSYLCLWLKMNFF